MPPKRKRTDADTPVVSTSRSTRSTARGVDPTVPASPAQPISSTVSKSKSKTSTKLTANEISSKKAKTSKTPKRSEVLPELSSDTEEKPLRKSGKKTGPEVPQPPSKKKALSAVTWPVYSRRSMENMFATYADEEEQSAMGAEGLEKLCADAKIPMEGVQPLLLAWLLEASELGKFKKDEWCRRLDALQIDNLEKLSLALSEYERLLISNIVVPRSQSTNKKPQREPYNRDVNYWVYTQDVSKAFIKFYNFAFLLAKAPQERNIDIETAKALWVVLLSEKYPIVNDLIEFIRVKGTVKGVNKDLWGMTLDFCETFNTSLEGFDSDGAWPTLLDEFYAWKKTKRLSGTVEGGSQIDA